MKEIRYMELISMTYLDKGELNLLSNTILSDLSRYLVS